MKKEKIPEAMLAICTGMMVLYLFNQRPVFLYIALATGITGLVIKPLAGWIAVLWYKVGEWLGFVVSKVLLTVVFFVLLVPVAALYRLFHKDPLHLKNTGQSNWSLRNHEYTAGDLKNIW